MTEAIASDWSPSQQRMLRAMGYQLLWRPPPLASVAAAAVDAATADAVTAPRLLVGLPHPPPQAGSAAHSLLRDVLRSAGMTPERVELRQVAQSTCGLVLHLPSLGELASSASTRRALWPTLRALRRRLDESAPR